MRTEKRTCESVISVYDNDSGERQDAMASMFLYMTDTGFGDTRQ